MSNGMGDEIAVLDGLEFAGQEATPVPARDGRIGRRPATGAEYASRKQYNYETRGDVLDASEGANYAGGSSYAKGLPLGPSTWGLAELRGDLADQDLMRYSQITSMLPVRKDVVDPSGGANYSGGSNYVPGMPLVTSGDAGLAASGPSLIQGGYGYPGLGRAAWAAGGQGGYGRAGLGQDYWERRFDTLDGVPLSMLDYAFGSSISVEDGRIGRRPATGAEYASRKQYNYETRSDVLDASEGANYSGGSSYGKGLPLGPSSWGLAELSMVDTLDGLADTSFLSKLTKAHRAAFKRVAGKARVDRLKGRAVKIRKAYSRMTPLQRQEARRKLVLLGAELNKVRRVRRGIFAKLRQQAQTARSRRMLPFAA
jgi:hypothetical protein